MCPIYEYKCDGCEIIEEILTNTPAEQMCVKCKDCGRGMDRIMSVPSEPRSTGKGFYKPTLTEWD